MNRETIKKIIDAGNLAPSGGNSQPWKFRVEGDIIHVTILPKKDHPVLNFRNRGTYVALGSLMENIEIASKAFGYEAIFNLPHSELLRVSFKPLSQTNKNELFAEISRRNSNRKFYHPGSLSESEKSYLFEEVDKFPTCDLILIEGEKIRQVAGHLALDILVSLQNEHLHKLLFEEVLFKEEEQKSGPGLYIKTMEVSGPKAFVFKLLKNWRVAKFFHKAKLTKKMYEETVKKAASSGLMVAIAVDNNDESFIQAGKLLENIWLRATKLNLSCQIVTSILFLWQQVNFGKHELFSMKDKKIINEAYRDLAEILGVKNKILALTFRIGKADKPMATSFKRSPEIEWA